MSLPTPVVLFAYARPDHLARVLECLKENQVPLIWFFSDGAKGLGDKARVHAVRDMLSEVDWCEIRITERSENLGLGQSVLSGVTEVAKVYEQFVVWEDDLVCVPGTYAWIVAALDRYCDDAKVMSISAWTHPRVTPVEVGDAPYFDRRADCWVWGGYARSWSGMGETALTKMAALEATGEPADFYGADLPMQARDELPKNIWAVRWLYHHFQHERLCLRPPWSMVEHIGFDEATNASGATNWINPELSDAPPVPVEWPTVVEHPACQALWQEACPQPGLVSRARRIASSLFGKWKGEA
jgi:hypothetical protein